MLAVAVGIAIGLALPVAAAMFVRYMRGRPGIRATR